MKADLSILQKQPHSLGGFKSCLLHLLPRRMWKSIRWEFSLRWRLLLQTFSPTYHSKVAQWKKQTGIHINLGALDSGRPGWLNVDAIPNSSIDFVHDVRKPLPLPDQCAQCIFCEHVMEHLDLTEEVPSFLLECKRLLQPGGFLRIIVPDAGKYCRAYTSGEWKDLQKLRNISEYKIRMEVLNEVFYQDGQHLHAYDEENLKEVIKAAGFKEIQIMSFGTSRLDGLALEKKWRAEESIHLECIR